jgi:hypothetical protein
MLTLFRYSTTLIKSGSSGATPSDIDIPYDEQKVGAGWNLYGAGKLTTASTSTTVTTGTNYFKSAAPYSFIFPQQTIDFGAFLEAEPEANAINVSVSISAILALTFAIHF